MGIVIIIAIVVIVIISLVKSGMSTEIQKCNSIKSIVMAINYGKVHPYNTGMSLETVKWTVKQLHSNTAEFENTLSMYELSGRVPSIDLPSFLNAYIEKVSIGFNKNNVVSSITIKIKDFHINRLELLQELNAKFGRPQFTSDEFIAWKNQYMTISVHATGQVDIWDDRLMAH
jgi:hypothetical protein